MKLKIANELTEESLKELFNGSIIAIKVKNFISDQLKNKLNKWVTNNQSQENYTHEIWKDGKPHQIDYGVTRIGTPFNLTYSRSKEMIDKYYRDAQLYSLELKKISEPSQTPVEIL